jgi:hypothetical protein
MLILGASAADSPFIELVTAQVYLSSAPPIVVGADGCPALVGSMFDPRMLCATDLGADWVPAEAALVQLCPPSPLAEAVVLANGTSTVFERVVQDADPASAVADVQARVSCAVGPNSKAFGTNRELPALVIPGTNADAQVIADLSNGDVEIMTIAAVGSAVLEVGVAQDAGRPDNTTVLRIVTSALQRFQNPRPSGGPFAPVMGTASVVSPAP